MATRSDGVAPTALIASTKSLRDTPASNKNAFATSSSTVICVSGTAAAPAFACAPSPIAIASPPSIF